MSANNKPSPFKFDKAGTYSVPASVMHVDSKVPFKFEAAPAEVPVEDAAADTGDSAKHPIAMLARTSDAIDHWYWGRIVHDLSGMKLLKDKVAVDWCHDYDHSIGYLDQFSVDEAGLQTKGFLIPFGEDDITHEVIAKGLAGVPYEASIDWSGQGTKIEFVPEGISTQANGKSFDGPIYVVREWPLTACALCPHGADPGTMTQFAKNDAVEINIFTQDKPYDNIEETQEAVAWAKARIKVDQLKSLGAVIGDLKNHFIVEKPEQEANDESPSDGEKMAGTPVVEAEAPRVEAEPTKLAEAKPSEPQVNMADLRLFVSTFGAEATAWLLEGKSFADCTKLAIAGLTEQLSHKDKLIEDLKKRLADVQLGEVSPVSFGATEIVVQETQFSHLSPNAQKYIANTKLPK